MQIVIANEDQLEVVRQLAHATWPHTFRDILSADQISYMLNMMYSHESLAEQFQNGVKFILAADGEDYCGFAGYELHYGQQLKTKLHKIYVLPDMQGKGVGKLLMEHVVNDSLKHDIPILSLNVNRFNNALEFYKRTGFSIVGEEDIDIGSGYLMEDYIMEKPLTTNTAGI